MFVLLGRRHKLQSALNYVDIVYIYRRWLYLFESVIHDT